MELTRRDVLVTAATLAASAAFGDPLGQEEAARGRVLEAGSLAPLPGVMVSNGRTVVRTDAGGHYEIPVRDGDAVFVVKPRGWMVPLEPHTNLPRFSYLHVPHGTPADLDFRFPGIAPTGPLPESIDFHLTRATEPDRFDVLLFTDPQPESDAELTYVRDTAVSLVATIPAAFGITAGDVMFDDLSLYGRSNRMLGTLNLPWWNVCGNHDMNYEAPDNFYSRETFKRLFGARRYAFQYARVTFIMLDNVEYLGNNKYQGQFGAEQLGFLRDVLAALAPDDPVVICFHIPLRTAVGDEPHSAAVDWQDFLVVIGDRPNCVSFAGHTHTNEHHYLGAAQHHHHVLTAVSGSWWSGPYDVRGVPVALAIDGTPNGFHILSVDGAACRTRFLSVGDPQAAPLRICIDSHFDRRTPELALAVPMADLLGGRVTRDELPATRLLVNFFPGGPRASVRFSIDGAGERVMAPAAEPDPFVQQVYWRNQASKKPWVQPVKSTHLWHAALPPDLRAGAHRVTVRATDEFGAVSESGMVLEVTG